MTGAIAGQAPPAGRLAVFLVAAEESGDRLGAALMDALARQHSGALSFAGVGGGAMAAAAFCEMIVMTAAPAESAKKGSFSRVSDSSRLALRPVRAACASGAFWNRPRGQ